MPFVYVSERDVIAELSVDALVKELTGRDGWREAVLKHMDNSPLHEIDQLSGDLRELIEAARMGRDTSGLLRVLADRHFGMVL